MADIYMAEVGALQLDVFLNRLPPAQQKTLAKKTPEARSLSLCAYLLLRVQLCAQTGLHNTALAFQQGRHGKPYLAQGPCFSLSHTAGAVAVALSAQPVGVDIERVRPAPWRVAERCFQPEEQSYAMEYKEQADRGFFTVWTRKEACMKRDGRGLAMSMRTVNTLQPPWVDCLITLGCGPYILSCCCEGSEAVRLHTIGGQALLQQAEKLDIFQT